MKLIRTSEVTFKIRHSKGTYGTLEELGASGLIDSTLAGGNKDGYRFAVQVEGASFKATAVPLKYGQTGSWSFYLDDTGVIRGAVKNGEEANSGDPPIRYQQPARKLKPRLPQDTQTQIVYFSGHGTGNLVSGLRTQ